jgi:hypothetical protein
MVVESPAMEKLGHSQISLTMDNYVHVIPVRERDSADKVGALLAGSRYAACGQRTCGQLRVS